MTELDPRQDLLEEPPGTVLCQLSMLDNVVKQLSAGDVFHDHKNVGGCGDDLVELDDVGVTEQLQVLNLPPDLSHHVKALDLLTVQNFHGHFVPGDLVEPDWNNKRVLVMKTILVVL